MKGDMRAKVNRGLDLGYEILYGDLPGGMAGAW